MNAAVLGKECMLQESQGHTKSRRKKNAEFVMSDRTYKTNMNLENLLKYILHLRGS